MSNEDYFEHREDENIVENKELNIWEALIPVVLLMLMLAYNIFFADGEALGTYSNQIILLIGGAFAAVVGFFNKVTIQTMLTEIWENLRSVFLPIMILFLVGALAGTWLVSGIIPAMVYYGLQVLSPSIFTCVSYYRSAYCNCNGKFLDYLCNRRYCFSRNWYCFRYTCRDDCRSCNFWSVFWR